LRGLGVKFLKWVLVVFGGLVLVLVTVMVGVLIWASTVETEKLTAADFEIGGTYSAEERDTLFNACKCNWLNKALDEAACTCLADNAGTKLSRTGRLITVFIFEASPTRFVAFVKGLCFSGVERAKWDEMDAGFEENINSLMRSCGFNVR
jgi:hypothetical protein